ncbi:MAG: dehydrogenase [Candidatus Rokuibacteriota bacterium]|nr:MAG: dehydrogenase [Candidatus Rokubacteria bacterium]
MGRRALVVDTPGSIGVVERADLEAGPGYVVVRTAYCGVCGTDLELLRGEVDPDYVRYPLTLGHEWSGTVQAVGAGVEDLAVGARCVAECIVPCNRCASCKSGRTNVCEVYDELGFTREGGASDQVLVPARLVHTLYPEVSLLDAALIEPCSVVFRALEKAGPEPGARVLVVGDGTIGLLAAYLVGLWTPASVEIAGRRAEQAELAEAVGVTSFRTDDALDGAFDLTIEAAGAPEAVVTAVSAARRGGTVVLLGLPPTGVRVELPADLLVNNDLTLAASFGYTSAAWRRTVGLVNEGRIRPGRIVTHRFALDDHARAFEALEAAEGARGKIMLEISGED